MLIISLKGFILNRLALMTTLHKNARKYTQKIPKTRILLLIIRILRLKKRKNNITVTLSCESSQFGPSVTGPDLRTQQKMQPIGLRLIATTLATYVRALGTHVISPFARFLLTMTHKHKTTPTSIRYRYVSLRTISHSNCDS